MKRIVLFIIIILLINCDLFKSQKEPTPNHKPVVSNAILTPSAPLLGEPVELNYQFTDEDVNDDDLSEPKWFRNDQLTGVEGKIFDPDSAQEDDRIYAEVTAYDGTDKGNTIKSNTVVYVREKFAPNMSYLSNVSGIEDEIDVGSVVKDLIGKISDQDHSLDELVIELTQTNPSLINLQFADNYEKLIIESYQENGSGENEVTIKVTDPDGLTAQKTFKYSISAMTDIEGSILDSDTWEPNNALQGFAIIQGDTVWADATGKYKTQINPTTSINIEAGYKSLDKANPMSFITTARSIGANNDVSGIDIMVFTYLNNNLTPEEQRIIAWETNFGPGNYTGAKVPSIEMTDKLILSGNPAIDWAGEEYLETGFTANELQDTKRIIADSINAHLKHPFPLEEVVYYEGILQEHDVVTWEKQRWANASISRKNFNNDGIIDWAEIVTYGIHEGYYDDFISTLLEEGYASRGEYYGVTNSILKGKTIAYEHIGIEWVHKCDIKFIKFIEGVAHEVGYLAPKIALDDVFKIQE